MRENMVTLITSRWFWLLVMLFTSSIATAVFANVFQVRTHKPVRVFNEALAGHQFGYIPYYIAIYGIADVRALQDWQRGVMGVAILLCIIFLLIGWYLASEQRLAKVFERDHGCPRGLQERCGRAIRPGGLMRVAGANVGLLVVSFGIASAVTMWIENAGAVRPEFDLRTGFSPGIDEWFALHKGKGIPVEVRAPGINQSIAPPADDVLANNRVRIKVQDERFWVVRGFEKDFVLGYLTEEDLRKARFFNEFGDKLWDFIVTERLPPSAEKIDLHPLPLWLSTGGYGGGYSRYRLTDGKGNLVKDGAIKERGAEVVRADGVYYLVAVVEVNHVGGVERAPYAKFAVGQIVPQIIASRSEHR